MAKQKEAWVGLGEAAKMLGVHPSTIRAWANKGDLPSRRTPGGHRRFRLRDLEQWESAPPSEPAEAQVMVQNALGRARMQISDGQLADLPWYKQLDDEARQFHRTMGRRLLEILIAYLTVPQSRADNIEEARGIGYEYAEVAYHQGLDIADSVRAFLFFRDTLAESIIQLAEVLSLRTANEWGEKLRDVNNLTDAVLVSLIEHFEELLG